MSDETIDQGHSDWSQRIDRLLSGTGGEQVRQLLDDVRSGLDHVAGSMNEQLSGATAGMGEAIGSVRAEVESLRAQVDALGSKLGAVDAMRADLVRSLEAVAASQSRAGAGDGIDVEAVMQAQTERIIGGFAQRVGQLQNLIFEVRDTLAERIQTIERAPASTSVDGDAIARAVADALPAPAPAVDVAEVARAVADVVPPPERLSAEEVARAVVEALPAPAPAVDVAEVARAVAEALPAPAPSERAPDPGGIAAAVADALRQRLEEIEVAVRTDIDAGFRGRNDADSKQVDALGLRITNMSMSVNQALEGVRAQVDGMTERARALEAEQAAILAAIRDQVSGLAGSIAREVGVTTSDSAAVVGDRIGALEASVSSRIAALEEPLRAASDATAGLATLSGLGERLAVIDDVVSRLAALDASVARLATGESVDEKFAALEEIKQKVSERDPRLDALEEITQKVSEQDPRLDALEEIKQKVSERDPRLDDLDERLAARLERMLAPLEGLRGDLTDVSDMAIKLGALPSIEEQIGGIAAATGALPAIGEQVAGLARVEERLGSLDEVAAVLARLRDDVTVLPSMREHLRALAEDGDAASVRAELEKVTRAIGSFDARLGGVADQLSVVDEVRASLGELRGSVADGVRTELDEIRGRLGRLPDDDVIEQRLSGVSARIDSALGAVGERLAGLDEIRDKLSGLETLAASLGEVRARVDALPDADAVAARATGSIDATLGELAARVDALPAAIEALRPAIEEAGPKIESIAGSVTDGLAAIREQLGDVETIRSSVRALVESADAEGAKIAEVGASMERAAAGVGEDMERALSRLSVRLDGIESAVARTIIDVRGSLDEVRQGSDGIVEQLGAQLADLVGKVAALEEATGSVRAHLASLPGPSDISAVVSRDVGTALSAVRSSTESKLGSVDRELAGLASNINEIWMRVRSVVQGLETLGASVAEGSEAAERRAGEASEGMERLAKRGERLERLLAEVDARNDERLARRVAELEARVVAAGRAIETERDRLFLDAFDEMVERVSRGDRKLGKRLRGLIGRRRDDDDTIDDDTAGDEPITRATTPVAAPASAPVAPSTQPVDVGSHGTKVTDRPKKPATKKKPATAARSKAKAAPKAQKATSKKKTSKKSSAARTTRSKTTTRRSTPQRAAAANASTPTRASRRASKPATSSDPSPKGAAGDASAAPAAPDQQA